MPVSRLCCLQNHFLGVGGGGDNSRGVHIHSVQRENNRLISTLLWLENFNEVTHGNDGSHERAIVAVGDSTAERDKDSEVEVDRGPAPGVDVGLLDSGVQFGLCHEASSAPLQLKIMVTITHCTHIMHLLLLLALTRSLTGRYSSGGHRRSSCLLLFVNVFLRRARRHLCCDSR